MAMNIKQLTLEALATDKDCFKWLQQHGLIPVNPNCPICGTEMWMKVGGPGHFFWHCLKPARDIGTIPHRVKQNCTTGTFFAKSKFGIRNILRVMYYFSEKQPNYTILKAETSTGKNKTSSRTISKWLTFCREVCFVWVDEAEKSDYLLGGPGVIVEVDKISFGKKEFAQNKMDRRWILGIVETDVKGNRRKGRYRIEHCSDNVGDAKALIPLILQHVKPQTIIMTDIWSLCFDLDEGKFYYFIIDENKKVVIPDLSTKPQRIKDSWADFKMSKKGAAQANMYEYFGEFLYRREVQISGEDPFYHFLRAVAKYYPVDR